MSDDKNQEPIERKHGADLDAGKDVEIERTGSTTRTSEVDAQPKPNVDQGQQTEIEHVDLSQEPKVRSSHRSVDDDGEK